MKKHLYLSVISFFLSSVTIWFMPHESIRLILGIVFWIGLVAGFLFQIPITKARKADRKYKERHGIALFRFFSNKAAIVFDLALVISAVVAIAGVLVTEIPDIVAFGGVFGFVFSLEMHGVFNGRNYAWLSKR
jgi:hypothetical protein